MPTPLKLSTFADTFPDAMREKVNKLGDDLVQGAEQKLASYLHVPIGETGALGASQALESTTRGGLILGWSDRAAIGIDVGRVQSKSYRMMLGNGQRSALFSRLLGSDQAPEGFTKPAIEALQGDWDQVAQEIGKDFDL